MIVNNELQGMWKEAVVAEFKIYSLHSPRETEENYKKGSRIVGVPAQIRTGHFPNTG
jgi:hypothetical protein